MFPLRETFERDFDVNQTSELNAESTRSTVESASAMLIRLILSVLFLLVVFEPAEAQVGADLNISPKRVVFGPGDRSATVYIFNQGDRSATYTVELVDRVMLPDGQIVAAADSAAAGETVSSAIDLVQHTPRRITLEPRQSQAIRFRARPGEGGEHRTHLTVTALPSEDVGFTVEQATQPGADEVAVQVVAMFSVSIPIIVRDAAADARAAVENLTVAPAETGQLLSLDLVRQGPNSVYGDVEIHAGGADGQMITAVRGVAVYPEIERRTVQLGLPTPLAAGQTITVVYRDDDARPGEVLATATLVAP